MEGVSATARHLVVRCGVVPESRSCGLPGQLRLSPRSPWQVVFFWVLLARNLLAAQPDEVEADVLLSVESITGSR